jgi:hypothetical protein
MKYLKILLVGVCLLFAAAQVMAQSAADEAAVREANEQRIDAWNAKDENAYPAFLHDDCTSGFDGAPCSAGAFREEWKNAKLKVVDDKGIVFITPDVAIYRYTQEGSGFVDANGNPTPPGRNQTLRVFVKKDDKWLVAMAGPMQPVEE